MQDRLDRATPVAFGAFLVLAFVVLVQFGRTGWFSFGHLAILTGATGDDLFAPIEQHWTTVPLLVFRALFAVFGFRFLPYLVVAVAAHLTIAALLYLVARRAAVRAWVAALVTSLLVLFAPGFLSMIIPIQITQNLSIIGGLTQLLLADHEGTDRRRDALALLAGVVGLMSSGIMPAIVLATGLALLVRRGWRRAATQTVPLAVLFIAWFVWRQPNGRPDYRYQQDSLDLVEVVRTLARGVSSAWVSLGSVTAGALLLVGVLVVGFAVRFAAGPRAEVWRVVIAPVALALSSFVYLGLVAYQRSAGSADYIEWSHHRYNTIALCLPALAVAVGALVERWRRLAPALAAGVLVCAAANIRFDEADRPAQFSTPYLQAAQRSFFAAAHDPSLATRARDTPDALVFPGSFYGDGAVTYQQLLDWRDEGKFPDE